MEKSRGLLVKISKKYRKVPEKYRYSTVIVPKKVPQYRSTGTGDRENVGRPLEIDIEAPVPGGWKWTYQNVIQPSQYAGFGFRHRVCLVPNL